MRTPHSSIRRVLALVAAAGSLGTFVFTDMSALAGRGKPTASVSASMITLNPSIASLHLGDSVTFSSTVGDLGGGEYPMIYVQCHDAKGTLLYGQLDHPDTVFVLGGGSSLWWSVGGDANCTGQLMAYGGKSKGYDTIRLLAETAPFQALG